MVCKQVIRFTATPESACQVENYQAIWMCASIFNRRAELTQGNRICAQRECEAPAEPRFSIKHKLGRSLALPFFASEGSYAIALGID